MKNLSFLVVLFSTFLAPTLILSNTSKVDACDPSDPFCQIKEVQSERVFAANNDRAKLIILTLNDIQNISLKTDVDRNLTKVCYEQKEFSYKLVNHDSANHPNAYTDGYREGRMNAQKGEKYVPRTAGGEFSRGFDDGYYRNKSTGQNLAVTVQNISKDVYKWNQKCQEVAEKGLVEKKDLYRAKASNDRAKLIIQTFHNRPDIRNISLKQDTNLKLTGVCYERKEFLHKQVNHDNANHPNAYTDGYREGRVNAQKGEKYVPRTVGGEFSRGFDDGYYGNKSTGQDPTVTVQNSSQDTYQWNEKCQEVAEKELVERRAFDRAKASNNSAEIIVQTLRVQPDVQNISLKTDTDLKLTAVCYEQKEFLPTQGYRDNANHPNAYTDGYREGRVNAQKGEKYVPRTAGGEFSRGFEDGYYGNKSTGQDPAVTVQDSSKDVYKWNQKCTGV